MSDPAHENDPILRPPAAIDPPVLPDGPEGSFFIPGEAAELHYLDKWLSVELEFSEQNLFGSRAIQTNPMARLRTVYKAIDAAAPGALAPLPVKKDDQRFTLEEHLKNQRKFITYQVVIKGERQARASFVDRTKIYKSIWNGLSAINHPVAQAATAIILENGKRTQSNKFLPEHQQRPAMSDWDTEQLLEDLLLTTQSDSVRNLFNAEIKRLKEQA